MVGNLTAQVLVAFFMAAQLLSAREPAPLIARHEEAPETKSAYEELESPMVIEVSMGATPRRKSIRDLHSPEGVLSFVTWRATETGRYSCRQARVRLIEVRKEEKPGQVILYVLPSLVTGQARHDMDVTVSIISDRKQIRSRSWEGVTVGNDSSTADQLASPWAEPATGSTSKTPEASFEFTAQEFAALFGPDRAPSVRVVLKVDE